MITDPSTILTTSMVLMSSPKDDDNLDMNIVLPPISLNESMVESIVNYDSITLFTVTT